MIKHTTLLDLYLERRSYKQILEEYKWLVSDVRPEDCYRKLAAHFPMVSPAEFRSALDAIGTERAMLRRIRIGLRFQRALAQYRRYGRVRQTVWTTAWLCRAVIRKLCGGRQTKTLRTGGAVIALVGLSSEDRSELARRIHRWLGRQLSVRVMCPGGTQVRRRTLTRRRCNLLRRAYRCSRNGKIVVSDLYPLENPGSASGQEAWNGSAATSTSAHEQPLVPREVAANQDTCPPDLILELRAGEEAPAQGDAPRGETRPQTHLPHGCPVISISVDRDPEEVFPDVRRAIWEFL
jgi:hypothetical protein